MDLFEQKYEELELSKLIHQRVYSHNSNLTTSVVRLSISYQLRSSINCDCLSTGINIYSNFKACFLKYFSILVGEGGYGKVVKVKVKSDLESTFYAAKKIRLIKKEAKKLAVKELEILKQLDSPFIIKYMEHFEDNKVHE